MMKKLLCLSIIISLLICAAGCKNQSGNVSDEFPPSENTPPVEAPGEISLALSKLLELIEKPYSSVDVNIAVTTDIAELSARYTVTQSKVTYSIEQLNLLPSLDNITDISPDHKTTVSGEAVVENGEVTDLSGNKVALPSGSELTGRFRFEESNLQNIVVGDGSLSADVISASAFYGTEVDMSDVKVKVEYSDTAVEKITVTYKTEKSSVEAVYVFEG